MNARMHPRQRPVDFPTAKKKRRPLPAALAMVLISSAVVLVSTSSAVARQYGSGTASEGRGSFTGDRPAAMRDVGVDQKLGDTIPLDLEFVNQYGEPVQLGDYFKDEKPVILTPVYYNCPQLCTLILNGLLDAADKMEWTIGEQFHVVTYSFAENETAEIAEAKRRAYVKLYDREVDSDEWPFLLGSRESIDRLNEAIGYRINRQPDGLIAHDASIVFLTPEGRISQYMNDVVFEPRDVRLALVEASEGNIGTPIDKFVLFTCFIYDADQNKYVLGAWKLMRTFGLFTVVLLGGGLLYLFRREAAERGAGKEKDGLGLEPETVT